jgi:hypothetical protein
MSWWQASMNPMRHVAKTAKWSGAVAGAVVLAFGAATLVSQHRRANTAAVLDRRVAAGRAWADSLESAVGDQAPASAAGRDALAALYLERLRLGLGSPFRTIEQAQRDPAFEPAERQRIGQALLARTLAGDCYQIEPLALDLIAVDGEGTRAGQGTRHLALMQRVIAESRDPRIGELTLRLAYRLAAASGAVARRAPEIVASAAAQLRDRVLSRRDAAALVSEAAAEGVDPLTLLRLWRDVRRFEVERPVIVPLPAREERLAVERLPAVVAALESIAAGEPAPRTSGERPGARSNGVDEIRARRLADVAQRRDGAPQAPVTVTVTGYAPLIRRPGVPWNERAARDRFARESQNEESLAAEYALLRANVPGGVAEAAVTVLTAGAALRTYAQENAWLPGDAAPSARDVLSRHGVTVSFDPGVTSHWRPYLMRSLMLSLTDFRRVLPGYDPRGLRVHFGESPLRDRALALHAPAKRTIYFPPGTSAGVMAHEFAHDLDWLSARRYYGGPGWYRTDRAVRQSSDHLANTLRQLASATRIDTSRGRPGASHRPTEVFARNVDWFVSAALARDGRLNGYLSAVQDPVLTGYASATTPEAAHDAGSATLRALDEVTTVPASVRTWFNALFGAERSLSVHEVVRQVLEVPLTPADIRSHSPHAFWAPEASGSLFRSAPAASGAWVCLLDRITERSSDAGAARAVLQYAAEARARGMVRQWSEFARRFPAWSSWRLRALEGPPWSPGVAADVERELRDVILWRALAGRSHAGVAGALAMAGGNRLLAECAA